MSENTTGGLGGPFNLNITLNVTGGVLEDFLRSLTRSLNLTVVEPAIQQKLDNRAKEIAREARAEQEAIQNRAFTVGNSGKRGPPPTPKKVIERTPGIPLGLEIPQHVKDAYNDVGVSVGITPEFNAAKDSLDRVERRIAKKPHKVVSLIKGNAAFFPNGNTNLELPTMQRRVLGALIRLDNKFPDKFHRVEEIAVEASYPATTPMSHMVTLLRRYGFVIEAAAWARERGISVANGVAGYRILPQTEKNKVVAFAGSQTPISKAARKQLGLPKNWS